MPHSFLRQIPCCPLWPQDILHVGAIGYGWLSAAQSVGSVAVAFILAQKTEIGNKAGCCFRVITVWDCHHRFRTFSRNFALTFIALVLIGAGDAISTILRNTIRQLQTPDELRGRMISINQIFFAGGPRLGEVEAGLVAQVFGTPIAIITGGIGCLISVAVVAMRWPQLRKYNGDEPVVAGAADN